MSKVYTVPSDSCLYVSLIEAGPPVYTSHIQKQMKRTKMKRKEFKADTALSVSMGVIVYIKHLLFPRARIQKATCHQLQTESIIMFYELLKPASYWYFSAWQPNLHLMNSDGHISFFYDVWWSQWWFRWMSVSFNIQVHIRTAMCLHCAKLFIMPIRMHFQLSGGCLVHLQTKWAANLHYSVRIYPGISFTYTD